MHIRTRVAPVAVAALAVAGCAAAAQATPDGAPGQLSFDSQLIGIQFFTASGPITGFPQQPLAPGDRIIGQDRIWQHGNPAGHDNETCTVSFHRDVLCQDIVLLTGQGDLQVSWTLQWPASGPSGPPAFDGIIDGGTAHFAAAHGTFHAATLPNGNVHITTDVTV